MTGDKWEFAKECGRRLGLLLAILPFLYVLSIGPAAGWAHRRQLNNTISAQQEKLLKSFYAPLISAHNNCRPIGSALEWYTELWEWD